jgi:hypothetical protein
MKIRKEALAITIVVRRVGVGAAGFGWEIHHDTLGVLHIAPDRFDSMEAAYKAGTARLAEFIPKRSLPPGVTENRLRRSNKIGHEATVNDRAARPTGPAG